MLRSPAKYGPRTASSIAGCSLYLAFFAARMVPIRNTKRSSGMRVAEGAIRVNCFSGRKDASLFSVSIVSRIARDTPSS